MIPPLARVSIGIVMPALLGRKDSRGLFGAAESDRVREEARPVIATVDPAVSFPVKRTVRKETGRPLNASAET